MNFWKRRVFTADFTSPSLVKIYFQNLTLCIKINSIVKRI